MQIMLEHLPKDLLKMRKPDKIYYMVVSKNRRKWISVSKNTFNENDLQSLKGRENDSAFSKKVMVKANSVDEARMKAKRGDL